MSPGTRRTALWALVLLTAAGCDPGGVDATYGRARGPSVNGTGALAELLRRRGHTVRVARRLGAQVGAQADTIVRFAPTPGPPDRDEALWYETWGAEAPGRRLIYVPRDFDAESQYWAEALARLPADADPRVRTGMERRRDARKDWAADLPPPVKTPADPEQWFALEPNPGRPVLCRQLSGDWAEGIDPKAAALTRHQVFRLDEDAGEEVLLEGDGKPLVLEWHWTGAPDSGVLVVANGSFLLNEPLVHRARRPLALRVARWAGETPRRVVFVEGRDVLARRRGAGRPGGRRPWTGSCPTCWPSGWRPACRGPCSWAGPGRSPPPAPIGRWPTPRRWATCCPGPATPRPPAPRWRRTAAGAPDAPPGTGRAPRLEPVCGPQRPRPPQLGDDARIGGLRRVM
jgi:hypothetical protein